MSEFSQGEWEARTAERNAADWPKRPDMRASQPKPAYYCGATIKGPRLIVNGIASRNVRAWIRQCRQRVKEPGQRCRFHDGSGSVVGA